MNKCFRVIWNKARHAWVVACESAHGSAKAGRGRRVTGATLALSVAMLGDPGAAFAAALEEAEEKNLVWVMQMKDQDTQHVVSTPLLGAGVSAYEAGGGAANGASSVAIGEAAVASTIESVAAGANAKATGTRGTAVGGSAVAAGNRGTALGQGANAAADFGTAIGTLARATAENGTALGFNASASKNNSVALGANSTTDRADSVSVGSASVKRQVTNVAAGTQDTDAVNLLQLKQTSQSVSVLAGAALLWDANTGAFNAQRGGVASKISGVAAGVVSATSTDAVVGAQLHQTNERVGALENGISHSGLTDYFKANSTQAAAAATGSDSVAVGANAQASGANSSAIGANAIASHANSVALGAGALSDRDNSVSIGSAGNERQITHVAAGSADTDAVNVAQLRDAATGSAAAVAQVGTRVDAVDARVTRVRGDVGKLQAGTDGMFQTNNAAHLAKPKASGSNSIAGGAGAVASGAHSSALGNKAQASGAQATAIGDAAKATASNAVALGANSVADRRDSVSVGSAGVARQITHVAAATQASDAVNLGQLNSGLGNARAHTDAVYNSLRRDINELDDELSAGIAGAMAMAALPQPHSPGASMTSMGVGNFRGESTLAVGVSTLSKDGKWVTKLQGSTDSQGEVGVSVGVGYQWE